MKLLLFVGSLLVVALGVLPARADTIFDNGGPNMLNGFETTHWTQADDFTLSVAARLDSVKFWSFEGTGSFQGSFFWQIFSNSATNSPGTLLVSGTSANTTHVGTGFVLYGYAEFTTAFDIAPAVGLPAGVYWLALHNGPLSNNSDSGRVFWETTANSSQTPSETLIAPFNGPWYSHSLSTELAFQINGVLAPSVTALAINRGAPSVGFTTVAGQTYRLDYKDNMSDVSWASVLGDFSGTGTIGQAVDPDPNAHNLARRTYRLRLCPCEAFEGPSLKAFTFAGVPAISFTTVAGQTYRVEYRADIKTSSWTLLPGADGIAGTGVTVQINDTDPNVRNSGRRFYRAVLLQ